MRVSGLTAFVYVLVGVARASPQLQQILLQPYQNPWRAVGGSFLVPVYSSSLPSPIAAPQNSTADGVASVLTEEDPFAPDEDNVTKDTHVVDGIPVPHGQFPAQVVITRVIGRTSYFTCGGTLITRRHVLTAAQCILDPAVFGRDEDARVYFNTANLISVDSGMGVRAVKEFWRHPGYTPLTDEQLPTNDIGILLLDAPVFNIRPIRLAETPESFIGRPARVYGFGIYQSFDPSSKSLPPVSDVLRTGSLEIASIEQCWTKMPISSVNVDPAQYICAGGRQGACNADSGGPLMVGRRQVGVVSFGPAGCDSKIAPYSVYTRVGFYADWIRSIIHNHK